jgi:glutathione S-transferase
MASGSSMRPTLVYFADGKGRNELTRLIFAVGHIQYHDQLIDAAEYTQLRDAGKLPMGQLPVLRMGDSPSSVLPQSCAIARYAAKCEALLS